jgi:nitroreductase
MSEVGLYEAMSTCRAVRRLRPDAIPDDVLRQVLEAAAWAPTGGNAQPWRIVVVVDREKKRRLGELYRRVWSEYARRSREGLNAIPEAARPGLERTLAAGDHLADHFAETPVVVVFCFNPEHMAITDAGLGRPSVVGGASVYPAVQNLLLACRAEGLGCVLTTLLCISEPAVRELLQIPEPWATCAAVPIGYPVLRGHGPLARRSVEQLTYLDTWKAPFA